jgi:hypothetical protein
MSSTLGCTLTGDLPGTNTFSQTTTRKQLGITLTKSPKCIGYSSNKILIYEAILKPTWTNRIQLWRIASTSNKEILERFQSKALHMIVDTPRYVPNKFIHRDLQTMQCSSQCTPKRPSSEPHGTTRQQEIAKTPAKWPAYHIPSVIVVFVVLVFMV